MAHIYCCGFQGIYDVEHFTKTLRYDVQIVESIPEIRKNGKTKKMKAFQKKKEHGAIYLTPFSHRLAKEIDNPEYQRLRCRVNYHAFRFKPLIMELSNAIVSMQKVDSWLYIFVLRWICWHLLGS